MANSFFVLLNADGTAESIPEQDILNEVRTVQELLGSNDVYSIECNNEFVRDDNCFYTKFEDFPNSIMIVPSGGRFKINWFASHIVCEANRETNEAGLSGVFGNVLMCRYCLMPNKHLYLSGYTKEVADIICGRAKAYCESATSILQEKIEKQCK